MSDYVPPELLIEILLRLPVKSLLRFTSVCKSWYSLITSPNFITTHLNQTIATHKRNNPTLLLRYYDSDKWLMQQKEHYMLHFDDETLLGHECLEEFEFPFRTQLGYFRIVGSCNGLLCLSDDLFAYEQKIILWNPSIRQFVFPQIRSKPNWPSMFVLGFGVDPLTYEHKVVRIVYYKETLQSYKLPPEVEIYTISTGLWRSVDAVAPPYCMVEFMWTQAFFNGSVHWIVYDQYVGDRDDSLIVSFDMGDEVFGKILLPDALAGQSSANLSVTVIEGSLAVFEHDERRFVSVSCCIWVMKEYGVVGSWTKLVTVDLLGGPGRILGYRKNGEVLLSVRDNFLASYDPKTQKKKNLGIRGTSRSFYVDTYMETLVLLKGQNRILDGRL